MELVRQEYPALLASLSPNQSVAVFNDRVKHIGRLNTDVADWLQERRKVEETYALGLRKLARKQPPDESSELGIFTAPWQKIVSSTEALGDAHFIFSQRLERDVEKPLREFLLVDREVLQLANIQTNLSLMAKDIEGAQKKVGKLRDKGVKAAAGKVANATSDVDNATSNWVSQAPFVFERLQSVDESRVNRLRDVLTQFQTHEVDQIERSRAIAEQCLNTLLNVETSQEIRNFSTKALGSRSRPEPQLTRVGRTLSGPSATHAATGEDEPNIGARPVLESKHGGMGGLKRLGTVLGRKRQSVHPYGRASSPERKSSSNLNSLVNSFSSRAARRNEGPSALRSNERRNTMFVTRPAGDRQAQEPFPQPAEMAPEPSQSFPSQDEAPQTQETHSYGYTNGLSNPMSSSVPYIETSPAPATLVTEAASSGGERAKSQTSNDPISRAEEEAAASVNDGPNPSLKLDIRDTRIQDEGSDAQAALANVANTLRASTITRRISTIRGRRDVRNSVFVPGAVTDDASSVGEQLPLETVAQPASAVAIRSGHRTALLEEPVGSDGQSVRSGRSLSSSASASIKHPELHEAGLCCSVVEAVNAWFSGQETTRALVIGEIALAFNPQDISAPFGSEHIRLENFQVLEKVAPNPTFIEQLPGRPGEYVVQLSRISRTTVSFKYQVHLDDSEIAAQAPLTLSPIWKIEANQASVIVNYSLNPEFQLQGKSSLTFSHLVLIVHLDGARATSCQSKPVGTFSRERSIIYWRLDDVRLSRENARTQQLRARFITEAEAKPSQIEARWEITKEHALGLSSGLSVSKLKHLPSESGAPSSTELNPFSGQPASDSAADWVGVNTTRKIVSGTYIAAAV